MRRIITSQVMIAVRSDMGDSTHCRSQRVDCHLGTEDVVQGIAQTIVNLCRNGGRFVIVREWFNWSMIMSGSTCGWFT